jgi:diacylglycerol kinase family enzyme
VNEYSKKRGNAKNKYQIDRTYKGDIKELENSEAYKAFTDYILNNATDEERLKYFRWIDDNTGRERTYTNKKGEKCNRYFLNCVNVGLIADVMNMRRQTRSMLGSRTLSFIVSVFLMIFHRMDYKMNVKINSDVINRKVMTMCVGSGPGYGQTPNAVPYNGLLDVSVVYHTGLLQVFAGLWLLLTGRFLNHRSVHPYRTREVRIEEAKHALVSIDGRLMGTPVGAYYIDVEQEVIQFLIPD